MTGLKDSFPFNPVRAKIVQTPEEYDWSSYKFRHRGIRRFTSLQACSPYDRKR